MLLCANTLRSFFVRDKIVGDVAELTGRVCTIKNIDKTSWALLQTKGLKSVGTIFTRRTLKIKFGVELNATYINLLVS
jgi:hypothetical protein